MKVHDFGRSRVTNRYAPPQESFRVALVFLDCRTKYLKSASASSRELPFLLQTFTGLDLKVSMFVFPDCLVVARRAADSLERSMDHEDRDQGKRQAARHTRQVSCEWLQAV